MKGIICIVLLSLLAGCTKSCSGGGENLLSQEEKNGLKVFTFVRTSAYRSLDPTKQFDEASSELISNLYDTLITYHYLERPYKLTPLLVKEMPTPKADGRTYVFNLREGVKFIDDACFPDGKGRELTADDVIYSIKRFADANVNVLSYVLMQGFVKGMDDFREATKKAGKDTDYDKLDISGVRKTGPYQIEIEMTHNNPLALYPFAMTQMSIVPREAVEHYGDEFEHKTVGTGPFYVEKMERRGEIVLRKNPNYFGVYPSTGEDGDEDLGFLEDAGKKLPLVDVVKLPLIEEAQPAILSLQKGQVDIVGIDKNNFSKFFDAEGDKIEMKPEWEGTFKAYSIPGLSMENFKFNMKDPVVGGYSKEKKALRAAIAYILDTPRFINLMRNGRAIPLKTIVPHPIAGSEWDLTDQTYYEYNKEMAEKKLAEAGYPGGQGLPEIQVEYRASTTATRQEWEFIRGQLASIGIKAKANFQTFSAWLQKTEQGNFQVSGAGWMADYPDGENFYQLLYGPNTPPGPNDGSYNNPDYNKLYEEIRFMPNSPERFAKFRQLNDLIKEDVPVILRYNQVRVGLMTDWVKNMKRNIMYNPPLRYINIDLDRKAKGM